MDSSKYSLLLLFVLSSFDFDMITEYLLCARHYTTHSGYSGLQFIPTFNSRVCLACISYSKFNISTVL